MSRRAEWMFLSHVDWRWIKQRPHWFAEEARREGPLVYLFRVNPRRWGLPRNKTAVRRIPLVPLPLGNLLGNGRVSGKVLIAIQRAWLWVLWRLLRPRYVYVSHPKMWGLVPSQLKDRSVFLYDCMDDAFAMARGRGLVELSALENELCQRATVIGVSSATLATRLEARYGIAVMSKITLAPNGLKESSTGRPSIQSGHAATQRKGGSGLLGYAGTVSHWFDFSSLIAALETNEGARALIVGPRGGEVPVHPQITYRDPVEHAALPSVIGECDALIMPFVPNDIVSAVNPVKIYEYLTYDVPVIARRYGEVEGEFGEYVYCYDTPEEFSELVTRLVTGELRSRRTPDEVAAFLESRTWSARWEVLRQSLGGLAGGT